MVDFDVRSGASNTLCAATASHLFPLLVRSPRRAEDEQGKINVRGSASGCVLGGPFVSRSTPLEGWLATAVWYLDGVSTGTLRVLVQKDVLAQLTVDALHQVPI